MRIQKDTPMRGKYSPTVSAAYQANQEWFRNYLKPEGFMNDPEGFDSYGYNDDNVDRAGNDECAYYSNDAPLDSDDDYNWKYEAALNAWGFDGTKPVKR